ncbi:gamma-glutamyltransferase [Pseudovibrio flavus]|uniref:gamma-glutamyltransferase n=1 Tax=Pseudovibrio flavus TaxID=2529854 RepID=UPI00211D0AD2|nr:gamma-glutamyltransferase [Pseudovibrio flavus]
MSEPQQLQAVHSALQSKRSPDNKFVDEGEGNLGAVSSGSPFASDLAMQVLEQGGNAIDAAFTCALTMMLTDPANCSLAGRCQILFQMEGEDAAAIDGATKAPKTFAQEGRGPARAVPIPGALRALLKMQGEAGTLPIEVLVRPVIKLARDGFAVPAALAEVWQWREGSFADEDLKRFYLPQGRAPKEGEIFKHEGIATFLEDLLALKSDPFSDSKTANNFVSTLKTKGLRWTEQDLLSAEPLVGEIVSTGGEHWKLTTIGQQGWGHTLCQIVSFYQQVKPHIDTADKRQLALLHAIAQGFEDRPQHLKTLAMKEDPIAWDELISRVEDENCGAWKKRTEAFQEGSLADILKALPPKKGAWTTKEVVSEERDTTHLAVIDRHGNKVSITMSIGPHFGARIADPTYGLLLAHSYTMESEPIEGARDVTEQCPSLFSLDDMHYAIGGAGSERIPGAIAAVITALIDGHDLGAAMAYPRANWAGQEIRIHCDATNSLELLLEEEGLGVTITDRGPKDHLGIVHAVGRARSGSSIAAADYAYAGAAMAR